MSEFLMNDTTEIDIEIQLTRLSAWAERSLFYLAKMYAEQIQEGQNYSVFKKCVSISVLDFKLFDGEDYFYSRFNLRETSRNTIFTDKMEFHVIELPKLPDEWKDSKDDRLLWAKFISCEQKEDFEMLASKNPYIESAYQQLQVISQDKKKRLEYEARQKAILDYNQGMLEAERRGREAGEYHNKIQTAKNMIKKGFEKKDIIEITGLTAKELDNLPV